MFDERFIQLVVKHLHAESIRKVRCLQKVVVSDAATYEFSLDWAPFVCDLESPLKIDRKLLNDRIVSASVDDWEELLESDARARIDLCIAASDNTALPIEIKLGDNGPGKIKNDVLGDPAAYSPKTGRLTGTAPVILSRNFDPELAAGGRCPDLYTRLSDNSVRRVDPKWAVLFRNNHRRDLFVRNHIGERVKRNEWRIPNKRHHLMPHWLLSAREMLLQLPKASISSCIDDYVKVVRSDVITHFRIQEHLDK